MQLTRTMSDTGLEALRDLPPWYRDDPNVQAVVDVQAREQERFEELKRLVFEGVFIELASAAFLGIHEAVAGLSVNPPNLTTDQRRSRLRAFYAKREDNTAGTSWEETLTELIGENWDYKEWVPSELLGHNYILNPKFANDDTGWVTSSSGSTRPVVSRREEMPDSPGNYGWHIQSTTAASTEELGVESGTRVISVSPAEVISASAEVYQVATDFPNGGRVRLLVSFHDSSGVAVRAYTAGPSDFTPAGPRRAFPKIQNVTVPSGAAYVRVAVWIRYRDPIDAYITRFMFSKTPTVPAYSDGDDYGWEWSGSSNASASQEISPDSGQLIIIIPYGRDLPQADDIRKLIRSETPAHLDLIINYDAGFIVGVSRLGLESL